MIYSSRHRDTYRRKLGPYAKEVTLQVNNGTDFDEYTGVKAHVSNWQERDLVAGGPMKLGDLRLIILAETLPAGLRDLEQKDRIKIGDRNYGVIHWDTETRRIGDDLIAVEATVRG